MQIAISAIGTANPCYRRSQSEVPDLLTRAFALSPSENRLLNSIYKKTGIESRFSVLSDYVNEPEAFSFFPKDASGDFPKTSQRMKIYQENAITLAVKAIENCLESQPAFDKNMITHLITVSCTGMYAPGIDIDIVNHLSLNSSVKRTCVNFMGCYGTFNALKLADAICRADISAKVLIVSVEICTIHFQKSMSKDNMIANAIFADGAGALLIEANPENTRYLSLDTFHCDLLKSASDQMAWHIADYGFDIRLSSYVPETIESGIETFVKSMLMKKKLPFESIEFLAIHPGGLQILKACEKALSITTEQNRHAYHVLKNYGNMSSATIIFVLDEVLKSLQKTDHQKRVFSCAFGPGLTLEAMLLTINCI